MTEKGGMEMTATIEQRKSRYSADVHAELERRGVARKDVEKVMSLFPFLCLLKVVYIPFMNCWSGKSRR